VVAVHGRAAAGSQQGRPGLDEAEVARAHVVQQRAREPDAAPVRHQRQRPMVLGRQDARRQRLLSQAAHDLDAGEIALVHGAIEGLASERLLMQRAVGIAVEEAAPAVLELEHALGCERDQRPGELLVVQPLAALDRVHEMALDRVARREGDVVAALDHARAAALAEQALDRHGHLELGRPQLGVQRSKQARAACAQDQDIGGAAFEVHHAPIAPGGNATTGGRSGQPG
jgi:hypothetical protein